MDNYVSNAKTYLDFNGLDQLKSQAHDHKDAVLKEMAEQFEAIFMQMLTKSMRQANSAFKSDLIDSNKMDLFQDMFDKQVTLNMSSGGKGIGIADMIYKQLKAQQPATTPSSQSTLAVTNGKVNFKLPDAGISSLVKLPVPKDVTPNHVQKNHDSNFTSKRDFVNSLLESAKTAAKSLGVHPKFLLAQAALETAWGKKQIKNSDGTSSFNLFGIKANNSWNGDKTSVTTHEFLGGKMRKLSAAFRSYASFNESFNDYANFLKVNPRYKNALKATADVDQFAQELQKAGYATDPKYASKISQIMDSPIFKQIFNGN